MLYLSVSPWCIKKLTMTRQEFTFTVYTENQVGLLNRIAILFSRRKINIESLNTSPSEVSWHPPLYDRGE